MNGSGEMNQDENADRQDEARPRGHRMRIGSRSIALPASPVLRMVIGTVLIVAGLIGFNLLRLTYG